jgi:hypothetical protein
MATITSSSTRSKRKSNKPVTTSKGRANRSSASQAKVTNSGGGKPGSAKVTTGSGGTGTKPAPKPAAKPAAKVNGQQPRAITNGRSATMRQIRAKSIQAQRQAQGKSTAASRNPGITPDSARGQRISAGAKGQRVIGDSGQVRAAQTKGAQIKAQAQAKRGAKAAIPHGHGKYQASAGRSSRALA